MTPAELIQILRADYLDDASDAVDPELVYRWSDSYLLREIATAQRQACYRQDLRHLFDDSTAEICQITLVADQHAYALDSRILRIHQARLDDQPLRHVTQARLEAERPAWRSGSSGVPSEFFVTRRRLTLIPAPNDDLDGETLQLDVWREPLLAPGMNDDIEWPHEPEQLAHWVAYRAFSRPDPDSIQSDLAQQHLLLFERAFGAEVPAQARAELLAYPNDLQLVPERGYGPLTRAGYDFDRE